MRIFCSFGQRPHRFLPQGMIAVWFIAAGGQVVTVLLVVLTIALRMLRQVLFGSMRGLLAEGPFLEPQGFCYGCERTARWI